ncbi:MAG: hypothetical protein WCS56_00520 [Bacilli bacterium]
MDVQWFSYNTTGTATIYPTNITLNTTAAKHFENAYATLIGYETQEKSLLIKAVNKDDVEKGLYKDYNLYKIAIKPSYGRITGKAVIDNLCKYHPLNFEEANSYKVECEWNDKNRTLAVFLGRKVK